MHIGLQVVTVRTSFSDETLIHQKKSKSEYL